MRTDGVNSLLAGSSIKEVAVEKTAAPEVISLESDDEVCEVEAAKTKRGEEENTEGKRKRGEEENNEDNTIGEGELLVEEVASSALVPMSVAPRIRSTDAPRCTLTFGKRLFDVDSTSGVMTPRAGDATAEGVRKLALDVTCFFLCKVLRAAVKRTEISDENSPAKKRRTSAGGSEASSGGVMLLAGGSRVRCYARLDVSLQRRLSADTPRPARPPGDPLGPLEFERMLTEAEERLAPQEQEGRSVRLYVCQVAAECKEVRLISDGEKTDEFLTTFCEDFQKLINRCRLHNIDSLPSLKCEPS